MYRGFPVDFVRLLSCPVDAGCLNRTDTQPPMQEKFLHYASLTCCTCGANFPVIDGIVRLIATERILDEASVFEQKTRDMQAPQYVVDDETTDWQKMEIVSTMKALQPLKIDTLLLELGCGTGRFTMQIGEYPIQILASDFSLGALQVLSKRITDGMYIGLVQADCTAPLVAPGQFHVVLSTLVSNLPSKAHRAAMFVNVAHALAPGGIFVFSAHYYNLRARLRQQPQAGTYASNGIYRYRFRRRELTAETRGVFADVINRRIQIAVPLSQRLKLPRLRLSRMAESVPMLNTLAELLLVRAHTPKV